MPMTDIDHIAEIALQWHQVGRQVALATVMETWGSAPRRAGSQLVVAGDGQMMGSVSGGCVEGAVIEEALAAIVSGQSRVLTFGVSDEDAFAVGLACGGTIRVMVEPVGGSLAVGDLEAITEARARRRPLAVRALPAGHRPELVREPARRLVSAASPRLRLDP